jgi:hypothetical protein
MTTAAAPEPNDLLGAAREWYDAGYAVIPAHEDGTKRPFGPWLQYQFARPAWTEIVEWLGSGKYTGIGVICGSASSHAEMIEIEGPVDRAVERVGLLMQAAKAAELEDTVHTVLKGCVEQSAGGGLHLFLRVRDGFAKPNTKLAMDGTGTDRHVIAETRGEGGFVIVAPSPGRNGHADGTSYLFLNGSTPQDTPEVSAHDRDELHHLFTMALMDWAGEPEVVTPREASAGTVDPASTFGQYRAGVSWRDILAPQGWQERFTDRDGRTHWTRPGKDPAEGTSATTLEDGPLYVFSTSTTLPAERGLSKEWVYAHLNHDGDLSAASRGLLDAGYGERTTYDLQPWEAGLDPEADAAERELARADWLRETYPLIDWHALWADEQEEEWIIEPLLARRRLVALYSAPKVGKSLLMLEVAAAIATGKGMFGYPGGTPRRTLYVDFENDPRGDVRTRLINMGYGPGDLANLCYLSFPSLPYLDSEKGSDHLLQMLDGYDCEVVVIDTVSRAIAGEENENDTWLNFYKHTGLKLKQTGRALIRLDHSGKDETKGQRGGSAKSGDVDAVWRLSRITDDTFDLVCEAMRFPIADKYLTLSRLEGPLRHEVTSDRFRIIKDDLIERLTEKQVPKDSTLDIKAAQTLARSLGVKFSNSLLTARMWASYCSIPAAWTPETLPEEG